MKIPPHYILGAIVVGLLAALISMVLSQVGHDPLVSAIRMAGSTFGVTTTLALLIAGLWPGTRLS
ncbi:hypothetical protein [Streptomyces sp. NPDC090022]|uniref:hypothetical protein n=1 Tax=Streptomyces sp. NPDC090022 TaxID=3365920 RepID=UPI0038268572